MGWIYLIAAVLFETIGTSLLKLSNGFSIMLPSIGTTISYILCFLFLSHALKTIDMSVAYAVWGAVGILLVAIIGIFVFHEPINLAKIIFILLIVIGTVGLKLVN